MTASQFDRVVIPGEQNDFERDPESRKLAENQTMLDLPPTSAGDDELGGALHLSRIKSVIYGFSTISRPMVEVGVSP